VAAVTNRDAGAQAPRRARCSTCSRPTAHRHRLTSPSRTRARSTSSVVVPTSGRT